MNLKDDELKVKPYISDQLFYFWITFLQLLNS